MNPDELEEQEYDPAFRKLVYEAIDRERDYQDRKWGNIYENPHSVGEWILILRTELDEAQRAWASQHGDDAALQEVLQVAAVAVACLELCGIAERPKYGVPNRPWSEQGE